MGVNRSGIIYFIVIACLCQLIVVLEATISLTAYGDIASDGRLKCNGQCVLVCRIKPNSPVFLWEINKQIVFECKHNLCNTYGSNYTFSFDITQGIFNLSMDEIIYADHLKQFKCDDGSEFASFTARIKVIPEGSTTTISSSSDSSSTTIKVRTGCLSPSTSVSFAWYYFKEGHTPVLFEKILPLESTEEDDCTNGHCGGNGVVKVTSSLIIDEDPDGEYYYFQVLVNQTDADAMFIGTDRKFKLTGAPRPDPNYPVTKSITVSLHESVSLHFTAIAYPKPNNVSWQKYNGDVWIEIRPTNNINIYRSDLNFGLDIKAIVQESYGTYRLIIFNIFGSFEQLFFINAGNSENNDNGSTNVASFIAVGVGTFAVTVLMLILSIVAFKCIRRKRHSTSGAQELGNQRRATSEEILLGLRKKEKGSKSTYEQLDKSKNEIRLYTSIENIKTGFSNKDYVK
ncbi:uncharacterized protein LOC132751535 [Ruditapes philippinarum]|uniref:uncharacterized protein LOC132751535 n=1 Tax=Ruditapes philippinarum TaxID=129788 RepID=UPI00295AC791|nr:uncharacterized protein LOC132751535 [Ruditapes philippinarum]